MILMIVPFTKQQEVISMRAGFKNILLYGGIEKSEYDVIRSRIWEDNVRNLQTYVKIILVFVAFLFCFNMNYFGLCYRTITDIVVFLLFVGIGITTTFFRAKLSPGVKEFLVYLFVAIIFIYGVLIALYSPERTTVTLIVYLVFAPLLFSTPALFMCILVILTTAAFMILTVLFRSPEILTGDLLNSGIFSVLSCVFSTHCNIEKVSRFCLLYKNEALTIRDTLTGMRNRNNFETTFDHYPESDPLRLGCVFTDINNLHDINTESGHDSGDAALLFLAEKLLQNFGDDFSFRIGGDEFVCFIPDPVEETILARIGLIRSELKERGWSAAFGYAVCYRDSFDLKTLTDEAEHKMHIDKEQYYQSTGTDRRNKKRL